MALPATGNQITMLQVRDFFGGTYSPITMSQLGEEISITSGTTVLLSESFGGQPAPGTSLNSVTFDSVILDTSVNSPDTRSFVFSPSGTELYTGEENSDDIIRYNLSTPFDLSTASFNSAVLDYNALSGLSVADSIQFKPDGTEVYVAGSGIVATYSLSTNYDISTASFVRATDLNADLFNTAFGAVFSNDGQTLYFCVNGRTVLQYFTLSTPFNTSTATYVGVTPEVTNNFATVINAKFISNGDQLVTVSNSTDDVQLYDLATAYDATSGVSFNSSYSVTDSTNVRDVYVANNKLFLLVFEDTEIRQYSV